MGSGGPRRSFATMRGGMGLTCVRRANARLRAARRWCGGHVESRARARGVMGSVRDREDEAWRFTGPTRSGAPGPVRRSAGLLRWGRSHERG
eukprot:4432980-Heterocapsa_arctica.AAC.1